MKRDVFIVDTVYGPVTYMVLIPSRGRADIIHQQVDVHPYLNSPATIIAVRDEELQDYQNALHDTAIKLVRSAFNPSGYPAIARQSCQHALDLRWQPYPDYVVLSDDNTT